MRFLLLLTPLLAAAADPSSIDQASGQALQKLKSPGLVVMVVESDRITHAKGYGVASVETQEPVTPNHLFRVGSTTKMFVAATLLRLSERGKVSLRTPVGTYLHELQGPLADLTGHQLLTHTAGLMDRTLMYGAHDDTALAANIRGLQPDVLFTKPGQIYSYSNLGYAMAGRLIEVTSAEPFADAVSDLIFQPLGMKRTTFRPTLAMTYPIAQGHSTENSEVIIARPAADHSGYWPAGSMFTSGNDFARWAITVINGGKLDGRQALEAEVVRTMTMPLVDTPNGGKYGYGIAVQKIGALDVYSHGGSRTGYGSHFIWSPQKKCGVIAIANLSGADPGPLAREIFKSISGVNAAERNDAPPAKLDPTKLAGIYAQYTSFVTVTAEAGQLKLVADGHTAALSPTQGNCFTGNVCFSVAGDGRGIYISRGSRSYARKD